jgi:hypothetical protein
VIHIYLQQLTTLHGTFSTRDLRFSDDIFENSNKSYGSVILAGNKKGLPVWKLAYSFSVYIILPENTHQYLFAAADNSPWNIFHSRFAIFRRHF